MGIVHSGFQHATHHTRDVRYNYKMTRFTFLILVIWTSCGLAQSDTTVIELQKGTFLFALVDNFNPDEHKIDTCKTDFGQYYFCLIDDTPWFGSDTQEDLPRSQLTKLWLEISGVRIDLEIKGMFNPTNSNGINTNQFKLKSLYDGFVLYGFFSDGAGTYSVHWKIVNGSAIRTLISKDEEAFSWQKE